MPIAKAVHAHLLQVILKNSVVNITNIKIQLRGIQYVRLASYVHLIVIVLMVADVYLVILTNNAVKMAYIIPEEYQYVTNPSYHMYIVRHTSSFPSFPSFPSLLCSINDS
jgi:hypothetical protein